MVKIKLEEWQVKNLREYFGHNDKTQTEHWAYDVFNKAYKEQCNIPVVVKQSELFECRNVACNKMVKRNSGTVFCKKHRNL